MEKAETYPVLHNDNWVNKPTEVKEEAPLPLPKPPASECVIEQVGGLSEDAGTWLDKARMDIGAIIKEEYPGNFETEDDLKTIVDPEPEWVSSSESRFDAGRIISDDDLWEIVAKDLAHLRKRAIEIATVKANRDFDDRLSQAMQGVAV